MMLAPELYQRGIIWPLFSLYLDHVIPLGVPLMMSPDDLVKTAAFLNLLAFADPSREIEDPMKFHERAKAMNDISWEAYGTAPTQALVFFYELGDQEKSQYEREHRQKLVNATKACWESVVDALVHAQIHERVSARQICRTLKLEKFLALKDSTQSNTLKAEHFSFPPNNWWSFRLPTADRWPLPLQSLLERRWPNYLDNH